MNKKNYIQKRVSEDVWRIFRTVYEINHPEPMSDKQILLTRKLSDYVYEKFATQMSRDRLKSIFGEDKDE